MIGCLAHRPYAATNRGSVLPAVLRFDFKSGTGCKHPPDYNKRYITRGETMQTQLAPERQREIIMKVSWRLLPLIVLCYLINYIDRTNVSFAALTMNKDLGLT